MCSPLVARGIQAPVLRPRTRVRAAMFIYHVVCVVPDHLPGMPGIYMFIGVLSQVSDALEGSAETSVAEVLPTQVQV